MPSIGYPHLKEDSQGSDSIPSLTRLPSLPTSWSCAPCLATTLKNILCRQATVTSSAYIDFASRRGKTGASGSTEAMTVYGDL